MNTIMAGEATPAQIGGFLVALRLKGETADEIAGCAEAMRAHVLRVHPKRDDLVDTAGTGGDGANTWNISTAAGLVAAAAGAGVAKHGNRAASSATGAADVLEALGFELAAAARAARGVDRQARLRLPLRPGAPPGDEVRRAGAQGARGPHRVQRPRAAHEPCGSSRPGRRRVRAGDRLHDRRGARAPRRAPRVRRARSGRHRRALPRRPEPRLRGRRAAGFAPTSSTPRISASPSATRAACAAPTRRRTHASSATCSRARSPKAPIATRFS